MKRMTSRLFKDYDNGTMNRRQLLQALGLTAGAASIGGSVAWGQQGAAPAQQGEGSGPKMKWVKSSYPRSGPFKTISVATFRMRFPNKGRPVPGTSISWGCCRCLITAARPP